MLLLQLLFKPLFKGHRREDGERLVLKGTAPERRARPGTGQRDRAAGPGQPGGPGHRAAAAPGAPMGGRPGLGKISTASLCFSITYTVSTASPEIIFCSKLVSDFTLQKEKKKKKKIFTAPESKQHQ